MALCYGSNPDVSGSNVAVTGSGMIQVSASTSGPLQGVGNANPDNNFRYDPTLGTACPNSSTTNCGGYIYNLTTKGLSTGPYKVTFTVNGMSSSGYTLQFEVS